MAAHLPCPPLHEWLPTLFSPLADAGWAGEPGPRRVRGLIESIGIAPIGAAESRAVASGLLWSTTLDGGHPPAELLDRLVEGAHIVELAVAANRPVRELLGWSDGPLARAQAGQSRLRHYVEAGLCEVQQWSSINPEDILVTVARLPARA